LTTLGDATEAAGEKVLVEALSLLERLLPLDVPVLLSLAGLVVGDVASASVLVGVKRVGSGSVGTGEAFLVGVGVEAVGTGDVGAGVGSGAGASSFTVGESVRTSCSRSITGAVSVDGESARSGAARRTVESKHRSSSASRCRRRGRRRRVARLAMMEPRNTGQ
jgi:hypothetical protein